MNTEDLLRDAFAEHERLAPDADHVLSAVHERAGEHRSLARPLAMAASVVLVAGAAVGAVALSGRSGHTPAARHQRAAASSPHVTTPPRTATVEALTMPFDLGWQPSGSTQYLARRINVGGEAGSATPVFNGEYLFTVDSPWGVLDVDVQQMAGDLAGVHFKCGTGVDVTVAGRKGVADATSGGPCGYEVYFLDSAGGLMYVNVMSHHSGDVAAAQLESVGQRVAAGVRFPGTTQVHPAFGLSGLPAGERVRAFDVGSPAADLPADGEAKLWTTYELGSSATREPDVTVGLADLPQRGGSPGREVLGHATRVVDDQGYVTLSVLDAVDHHAIELSSARVPLADLYRIADGLVLPS